MAGRWFTTTAVFLCLLFVANAADTRGEALEKLLAELRQLREVQRQESTQARNEFRHLERLLKEKTRAVSDQKAALRELENRVAQKSKAVDSLSVSNAVLNKQAGELRASLSDLLNTLIDANKSNPILSDGPTRDRLEELRNSSASLSLDALTTQVISILLEVSNRVTTCQVSSGVIQLGKNELHVQTLRVGAIAELWMTRDKARCGLGTPAGGNMLWRELPVSELNHIIKAFAVAKEDSPAEVLLIPLPLGGKHD